MMLVSYLLLFFVAVVTCDDQFPHECEIHDFPCNDGSCVSKMRWCDGEVDCFDSSDEKYCSMDPKKNKCDDTFFRCKNGPCIPLAGLCDGIASCLDDSDEDECGSMLDKTVVTKFIPTERHNASEPISLHDLEHLDVPIGKPDAVESKDLPDGNLEKGFIDLSVQRYKHERLDARHWLLKVRDQDYGWGDETARALTALFILDDESTSKQQVEKMLTSKELHLRIFTTLIRNETSPIPLADLSLYINALSALCENPRNFHGEDLVNILRRRADEANKSKFVSPLVYITLCLNDAVVHEDIHIVEEMHHKTSKTGEIGIAALASLAATCISRIPKFSSHITKLQAARKLYSRVAREGFPNSIYQLSLVAQALNEARINQDLWNRSEALDLLLQHQDSKGSFGDILSTYYAVPILSGKSLLSLRHHCSGKIDNGLTPLEVLDNGYKMEHIHYSLNFGEPVEASHSQIIAARNSTNFLDIMRMAEAKNPIYRFRYVLSKGSPTVYSIGGAVNDPERGKYWRLYVTDRNSTDMTTLLPYEGDIRTLIPSSEEKMVFWFKSLY